MDIIDAVVLGLVQGLTEFIPVSSSGHLILANELFGLDSSFEFDVLLNIGTLLALVWYFRQRLAGLLTQAFSRQKPLVGSIVLGTIPAVVVGGVITAFFDEDWVRSSQTVAIMLVAIGLVMVGLDSWARGGRNLEKIGLADGLGIGMTQVVALIPGTSRSGITMIAGRLRGFDYKSAAEFSFLLGVPILSGAVIRVLLGEDGRDFVASYPSELFIGNLVSFVSGYWAVSFMIDWLGKHGLKPFGWYRIGLGLIVLIVSL